MQQKAGKTTWARRMPSTRTRRSATQSMTGRCLHPLRCPLWDNSDRIAARRTQAYHLECHGLCPCQHWSGPAAQPVRQSDNAQHVVAARCLLPGLKLCSAAICGAGAAARVDLALVVRIPRLPGRVSPSVSGTAPPSRILDSLCGWRCRRPHPAATTTTQQMHQQASYRTR